MSARLGLHAARRLALGGATRYVIKAGEGSAFLVRPALACEGDAGALWGLCV